MTVLANSVRRDEPCPLCGAVVQERLVTSGDAIVEDAGPTTPTGEAWCAGIPSHPLVRTAAGGWVRAD